MCGSSVQGHDTITCEWCLMFHRTMLHLSSLFLDCVSFKITAAWSFEMSGIAHPMTQHHIPEDMNLLQHHTENSTYNNTIFEIQKRVIRIMMNVKNRESCQELFKKLKILPLQSQYILSLLLCVAKNLNMFKSNLVVHTINTRNSSDLYLPSVHLSKVQKGVYH